MILKRKKEHLPLEVSHEQAKDILAQVKKQPVNQYIKIKIKGGFILVSIDKYKRKPNYYHRMYGIENILL